MHKVLIAGFMIAAGPIQAATQLECTMFKMCQPRVGCTEAKLVMSATASNSELRIGPADDVLVLKRVMGKLGKGITYADIEAPDSYTVATLRPDGEMYMSSHKNTKYGGLGTMNLHCRTK